MSSALPVILTFGLLLPSPPCSFLYNDAQTLNRNLFFLLETLETDLKSAGLPCPARYLYLDNSTPGLAFEYGSKLTMLPFEYNVTIAAYCPTPPCNQAKIEVKNDPTRVFALENPITIRFENVAFSAGGELVPLGHCVGPDYDPASMAIVVQNPQLGEKLTCATVQLYPLFSVSNEKARLEFDGCVLENIRYRPFCFILFFSDGSLLLSNTIIRNIDLAPGSAFVLQYRSDSLSVSIAILDCVIALFNPDHTYSTSKSPTAGFMAMRRIANLTILNTEFVDNVMLAGETYQANMRFMDFGTVDALLIVNVTYVRNMGGVRMVLKSGPTSHFSIQSSQFLDSYNSGGPLIFDIQSIGLVILSLSDLNFTGNGGEGSDPLLSIRLSVTSSGRSLLNLTKVRVFSNRIGGFPGQTAVMDVQGTDLAVFHCEFRNNKGFTSVSDGVYPFQPMYSYLLSVRRMPISIWTVKEKTEIQRNCSFGLRMRDGGNFRVEASVWIGGDWGNTCETMVGVENGCQECGGVIGEVTNCVVTNPGGVGVSITDTSKFAVLSLSISSLTLTNNGVSALIISTPASSSVIFHLNSSLISLNGAIAYSNSPLQLTTGSAFLWNLTVVENRGDAGGAISYSSTCEDAACVLSVRNCSFQGNRAQRTAGDMLIASYIPGTPLQFLIFSSVFDNSSAIEAGSAIYVGLIRSVNSQIDHCTIANSLSGSGGALSLSYTSGLVSIVDLQLVNSTGGVVFQTNSMSETRISHSTFTNITESAIIASLPTLPQSLLSTFLCDFHANAATAVEIFSGRYTDYYSSVIGHISDRAAGLLVHSGVDSVLIGTVVSYNTAKFYAGGVSVEGPGTNFSLTSGIIRYNHCATVGGGIAIQGDSWVYIQDSTISDNSADEGSAVYILKNEVTGRITGSVFARNSGKGVISVNIGRITVMRSNFTGNIGGNHSPGVVLSSSFAYFYQVSLWNTSGTTGCVADVDAGSEFSVNESDISGIHCIGEIVVSRMSKFNVIRSEFTHIIVENTDGFQLQDSPGTVIDSFLSEINLRTPYFSLIAATRSTLYVSNLTVSDMTGTVLRVTNSRNVTLKDCSVTRVNSEKSLCGGVCIDSVATIILQNCHFQGIVAGVAGGLMANNSLSIPSTAIYIETSRFIACRGGTTGGVLIHSVNTSISTSVFADCVGTIGGGVYISSPPPFAASISTTEFNRNTADIGGGVYWDQSQPTFQSLSFDSNSATRYGPDQASPPASIRLLTQTESLSIVPGHPGGSVIVAALCDLYGQVVTSDNSTEGELMVDGGVIAGQTRCTASAGLLTFQNYTISAPPGAQVLATIVSPNLAYPSPPYTPFPRLSISILDCSPGEILTPTFSCVLCAAGSFSLILNASACYPCPTGGICVGGTDLQPQTGYWRSGLNSATIWRCPNPAACRGGGGEGGGRGGR